MNLETANEIQRLEEALYRFCSTRQWRIVRATFPPSANTDLDIAHSLSPEDPEGIDFMILHKSRPCDVYRYAGPDRVAWSSGVVRLRCTAPSAQIVLLLSVSDDDVSRAVPEVSSYDIQIPTTSTIEGTSESVTIGTVGTTAGIGATGPGIQMDGLSGTWALFPFDGPLGAGTNNRALAIQDLTGGTGELPIMLWRRGSDGTYYLSPDDVTNATDPCSLGDIHQTSGLGRWSGIYARSLDVGTSSSSNTGSGIIHASSGFRERSRSTNMGEWTSWTPTWSGLTVGDGTVGARYTRIGKTVHYTLLFVFGSTSAVSNPTVTLPVNNTAAAFSHILGSARFYDADTGNFYSGEIIIVSSTTVRVAVAGSPLVGVSASQPFTWATGDQMYLEGTYEEV